MNEMFTNLESRPFLYAKKNERKQGTLLVLNQEYISNK